MAILLVPIIGALGMGAEATNWFLTQRSMQNAADSAVLAAARNGCVAGTACNTVKLQPDYIAEARSVTARMGFTNGVNETTVLAVNNAACPGGGTCYQVTITKKLPVYLLGVVGFNGNTTVTSGGKAQSTAGLAMAQLQAGTSYCITALANNDDAIQFKGSAALDLTGCDLASNGGASCNAHTGDTIRYATVMNTGDGKDCGMERTTTIPFSDAAFSGLVSNIPSPPCGAASDANYPQVAKDKDPVAPANLITTAVQFATPKCGDVRLNNDITITTDQTIFIYNGRLDLAGHTLNTNGAHVTVVLTGHSLDSGGFSPNHTIVSSVNGGVIDFAAPLTESGSAWHGIAVYQDPRLVGSKNNLNFSVTGNDPEFNITGMFYAPHADIEIKGAINHATEGDACLAFMVKTLLNAGTGSLFAYPTRECKRAGLDNLPKVLDRVVLVQ